MGGFKYRFAAILEQKKREEEKIRQEMSPLVDSLNKTQDLINHFTQNIAGLHQSRDNFLNSVEQLRYFTNFIQYYRDVIQKSTLDRDQVQAKLSPWTQKLRQAIANRKAFEIIRNKDLKNYKREQNKKEQQKIDSFSTFKHMIRIKSP